MSGEWRVSVEEGGGVQLMVGKPTRGGEVTLPTNSPLGSANGGLKAHSQPSCLPGGQAKRYEFSVGRKECAKSDLERLRNSSTLSSLQWMYMSKVEEPPPTLANSTEAMSLCAIQMAGCNPHTVKLVRSFCSMQQTSWSDPLTSEKEVQDMFPGSGHADRRVSTL